MYLFERTQTGDKVEFRHPGGFFFSFIIAPGTTEDMYLQAIGNCGVWTRLPQLLDRSITADEWKEYREEIDLRWPSCSLAKGNMEPKFFDDARKTIDRIHNAPFDCGEIRADGLWMIELSYREEKKFHDDLMLLLDNREYNMQPGDTLKVSFNQTHQRGLALREAINKHRAEKYAI
jgi:hypothetical protein